MDLSSGNIGSSRRGIDEEQNPLWQYVSGVEKGPNPGGNRKWTCNYCASVYSGSYTRVRAHLLKIGGKGIAVCKNVMVDNLKEMKKLDEEAQKRSEMLKPKSVLLPNSTSSDPTSFFQDTLKKRKGDSTVEKAFDLQNRNHLDSLIARMFYTGGLPFNLARNPNFVESYSFAANARLGGYVPPGYNKLRTTLLQQEKAHVKRLLEPIKSKWEAKGVTIVSDGWSDPQRRPIINFIVVSDSGPMFLRSIDCSGESKDTRFIADRLEEVINEVGDTKVVQIITDNASNCKAAGKLIEGKFPGIYWTPCVVHTLNLALKNICAANNSENNREVYEECSWISQIKDDVLFVKNFVMKHQMRLAIFNCFCSLKLLSVADTRFASTVVMLRRFKLLKNSLISMVVSEEWREYKEDNWRAAQTVRDFILDEGWWEKISYIIEFTGPIYDMLRACDTDRPCLHLVYEMWDSMIEKVKKVIYANEGLPDGESLFYNVVHEILVARWTKNNNSLHCLVHSLNPRYYSEKWIKEGEGRVSPNMDPEVSIKRNNCFKRFFQNDEERNAVTAEYALFTLGEGSFNDSDAIASMYHMEPRSWWSVYGTGAPFLQKLALRVLGQPSSSSCSERNWSIYSFIHSMRRNKLTPKRAEHLVFVHNNLRLLSRNNAEYKDGKTKMWDVGGDDFGSMEDTAILEVANLSLDEPELETALCEDVDNNA